MSTIPAADASSSRFGRVAFLALLAASCLSSCHFKFQPRPPTPLTGIREVAISFNYSEMTVEGMSMEAWIEKKTNKDKDYPKTWDDLMVSIEGSYFNGFRNSWRDGFLLEGDEEIPEGAAHLEVSLLSLEMGKFIPMFGSDTRIEIATTWAVDGEVVAERGDLGSFSPTLLKPSIFQHVKPISQSLGKHSGRFMRSEQR